MKKTILLGLFMSMYLNIDAQIDTVAVKTIEGTVNKMLEIISGDIDEPRDWDNYRNLFLPTAKKYILYPNAKNPNNRTRAMNLEEFIRIVGPSYKKNGFEEIEIGLTINEFNGIANVFQCYYAKNLKGTYERRGINSYQLVFISNRWWIVSTTWANETSENKIPNKYLKEGYQN